MQTREPIHFPFVVGCEVSVVRVIDITENLIGLMVQRMNDPLRIGICCRSVGSGKSAKHAIEGSILFNYEDNVLYGIDGISYCSPGGSGPGTLVECAVGQE
jgi:hypothetical protein